MGDVGAVFMTTSDMERERRYRAGRTVQVAGTAPQPRVLIAPMKAAPRDLVASSTNASASSTVAETPEQSLLMTAAERAENPAPARVATTHRVHDGVDSTTGNIRVAPVNNAAKAMMEVVAAAHQVATTQAPKIKDAPLAVNRQVQFATPLATPAVSPPAKQSSAPKPPPPSMETLARDARASAERRLAANREAHLAKASGAVATSAAKRPPPELGDNVQPARKAKPVPPSKVTAPQPVEPPARNASERTANDNARVINNSRHESMLDFEDLDDPHAWSPAPQPTEHEMRCRASMDPMTEETWKFPSHDFHPQIRDRRQYGLWRPLPARQSRVQGRGHAKDANLRRALSGIALAPSSDINDLVYVSRKASTRARWRLQVR